MLSPQCHTSRSVVGRAILIPAARRAWQANAYVFFGLAWDPTRAVAQLTQEYASLTFGKHNAEAVS